MENLVYLRNHVRDLRGGEKGRLEDYTNGLLTHCNALKNGRHTHSSHTHQCHTHTHTQ